MPFKIPATANRWLAEVEALEEHLEAMKLTALKLPRPGRVYPLGIVRATAGFLGKKVPPGKVYERQLRRSWEHAFHKRVA